MNKYTEAIQGDDVVILCDGIPMGVGEILDALNAATPPADAALVGKLRHQLAQVTDECARLRALSQPAVPPALVTAALGTGGGEKLFVPVHIAVEAAHIAARGQHAAAIEYAHRYAQPAAPVAQVPELYCVGRANFPPRGGNAGISWHVVGVADVPYRTCVPKNGELLFVLAAAQSAKGGE